jgi:hypothetical protein
LLLKVVLTYLISVIGSVILLISHEVSVGYVYIVIRELTRFKLDGRVNVIIAKIFRFILIVNIVFIVFFLSNLRELFIFDERLVHLKSFWLIFYEVSLFILLIAHVGSIFELYKLTI